MNNKSDPSIFSEIKPDGIPIWITRIRGTKLYGCWFTSEPTQDWINALTGHGKDDCEIVKAKIIIEEK